MSKPLWFPVTKKQREEMKKGVELLQHYHDVLFPEDTVAVVMGLPFDREKYNYLLARGIDIIPIELTKEQIDKLDDGALIQRSVGLSGIPIQVHIVDTEEYAKFQRKAKK
uniref:Uncharacterized protein n=1 Tax=viral metagenome TaxID=1070528 RepID=A0A6M3LUW3_9ZZZZ